MPITSSRSPGYPQLLFDFCTHGVGVCYLSSMHMYSPTWKSSPNTILWGFLWRLHHVGMINYEIHFFSPSLLCREWGGWNWKFQVYNHGLVFPMSSPHLWACQKFSHLNKRHFCHPGKIPRDLGALCQKPIYISYYFSHLSIYKYLCSSINSSLCWCISKKVIGISTF